MRNILLRVTYCTKPEAYFGIGGNNGKRDVLVSAAYIWMLPATLLFNR